jgi:hypothetical protein
MDGSRGEYLCIFHDHDRHDTRIISKYVTFLEQHRGVGVVCSDWDLIDDAGDRIGVRDHDVKAVTPGLDYIEQTFRSGRSSIGIPGAMVRRSALGEARFIADAPIGFGDFALWFRLAESCDIGHVHERLWSWRQNKESHSARTIEAISHDYDQNLSRYCDEHIARWPNHTHLVERWRASIRRYLFWALAYEVALHFTDRRRDPRSGSQSLFEIMDYRLTPEQFQHALAQLKVYRTGIVQYCVFAAIQLAIRFRLTSPFAWLTRHRTRVRALLGFE